MTKDKDITIPAGTLKAGESIILTFHGNYSNYCEDQTIADTPQARELRRFLFGNRKFPHEK